MSAAERLQALVAEHGLAPLAPAQAALFEQYLALYQRWNARVNLSAIRDEDGVLRRHFFESIVCARRLPSGVAELLDYGSGGGFPGVPIAICRPELQVTLAESQTKKAAFLQEVARELGLGVSVFAGRVEAMDEGERFDAVTLRAVDKMEPACQAALERVRVGGWLCVMTTLGEVPALAKGAAHVAWRSPERLPGSEQQVLLFGRRLRHG